MKEKSTSRGRGEPFKKRLSFIAFLGITAALLTTAGVISTYCSEPIKEDSNNGTSTLPLEKGITSTIVDFKKQGQTR